MSHDNGMELYFIGFFKYLKMFYVTMVMYNVLPSHMKIVILGVIETTNYLNCVEKHFIILEKTVFFCSLFYKYALDI